MLMFWNLFRLSQTFIECNLVALHFYSFDKSSKSCSPSSYPLSPEQMAILSRPLSTLTLTLISFHLFFAHSSKILLTIMTLIVRNRVDLHCSQLVKPKFILTLQNYKFFSQLQLGDGEGGGWVLLTHVTFLWPSHHPPAPSPLSSPLSKWQSLLNPCLP